MWEMRHQQVLARTLASLHLIGIQPVLIKGTALAYSLYGDPAWRVRGDTDLIIPAADRAAAHDALIALGYVRSVGVSGELVSYQASYTAHEADGSQHTLDLHWKINNSELLARLFTYEELRRDATPLAGLSAHALGPSHVQSLLLACMHRSTHKQNPYYIGGTLHHEADRLIWLYDIHLLAQRFTHDDWNDLASLATQKGLRAVCLEGMSHARACFHTQYPQFVLDALARPGAIELPDRYLGGGRWRQQWMDLLAVEGLPNRGRLLRELAFPPADYMRARFGAASGPLAWLYLRRAVNGVVKRLRPVKTR